MTFLFFLVPFFSIWMDCVGKTGYFTRRCIFYNIYLSRVVENLEYNMYKLYQM